MIGNDKNCSRIMPILQDGDRKDLEIGIDTRINKTINKRSFPRDACVGI